MKLINESVSNSYWDENGELQAEYDLLFKKYVPSQGQARHKMAEVLRCITNLYYDYCNNGWGVNDKSYEIEQLLMTSMNGRGLTPVERKSFRTVIEMYNMVWDNSHTEYEDEEDYYEDEDNDYGYGDYTHTELYEPTASEDRKIMDALDDVTTSVVKLCINDGLMDL